MIIKSEGIITRSIKYSESSLILDIYTRELGKQSFIISGVRNRRSKTPAGILQVMSQIELLTYYKDNNRLNRIKEVKPALYYKKIPFDPVRCSIGIYMTEVIQRAIREPEQNDPLFLFLKKSYIHLDEHEGSLANLAIGFMIYLSKYLGFYPHGNWSTDTPYFNLMDGQFIAINKNPNYDLDKELSYLLYQFTLLDLTTCHQLEVQKNARRKLLVELIKFYQLHIENFGNLRSVSILSEVLH